MRRHRLCLARRSRRMDRGGRSLAAFVRHTRIRALWAVLPWVLILASSRIQEVEAAFPTQLVSPYESAGNEKAFLGQLRPMLDEGRMSAGSTTAAAACKMQVLALHLGS
jgi:hypothetical protein